MSKQSMPSGPNRNGWDMHRGHKQWEMCLTLYRVWRDIPDLRLGQLIAGVLLSFDEDLTDTTGTVGKTIFYVEDDVLWQGLYDFWLQHSKRGQRISAIRHRWRVRSRMGKST